MCQIRQYSILIGSSPCWYILLTRQRTLFCENKFSWPLRDSADPIDGWTLGDVLEESGCADHDIYGLLHLHVRRLLQKFCEKLSTLKLDVRLYQMDATFLPTDVGRENHTYDRIEVTPSLSTSCAGFFLLIPHSLQTFPIPAIWGLLRASNYLARSSAQKQTIPRQH